VIREAERRGEAMGVSASSLVEMAIIVSEGRKGIDGRIEDIFAELDDSPLFQILPITTAIALDAGRLSILRDPADRTIAATARVHGLRLLTSDRRIVDSKFVSVIE
jgi:PIN domain nuclease of toxin-antitoxin system